MNHIHPFNIFFIYYLFGKILENLILQNLQEYLKYILYYYVKVHVIFFHFKSFQEVVIVFLYFKSYKKIDYN
jgi:hypothetical protein